MRPSVSATEAGAPCFCAALKAREPDTSLVSPQGREWFYDERDQALIYKPNGTATPTGRFVGICAGLLLISYQFYHMLC